MASLIFHSQQKINQILKKARDGIELETFYSLFVLSKKKGSKNLFQAADTFEV
jgi:hypothetical protein